MERKWILVKDFKRFSDSLTCFQFNSATFHSVHVFTKKLECLTIMNHALYAVSSHPFTNVTLLDLPDITRMGLWTYHYHLMTWNCCVISNSIVTLCFLYLFLFSCGCQLLLNFDPLCSSLDAVNSVLIFMVKFWMGYFIITGFVAIVTSKVFVLPDNENSVMANRKNWNGEITISIITIVTLISWNQS